MFILVYIFIFAAGIAVGLLIKVKVVYKRHHGTIYVVKDDEKTVYSLELNQSPESLEFNKMVVFKVAAPKTTSQRE